MHLVVSAVLALASAVAFAVATVAQQHVAAQSSDEDARGGRFVSGLVRDPRWLAAMLGNGVAYALQAAALGVGRVVVVEPILVCSLLVALPLSAHLGHQRLTPVAVRAGVLLSLSLSAFLILSAAGGGREFGSYRAWLVVAGVGLPVIAACVIGARRCSGAVRASLLAVAVGLLGGVLAVLTKSVVAAGAVGLVHLLASADLYGLVVVGLLGMYLQQLAFQAGALQTSLPIMTVVEPAVAAVLGVTLLHEHLALNGLQFGMLIAAAVTFIAAAVVLASGQATALVKGATYPSSRPRRSSDRSDLYQRSSVS